MSAYSLRQYVEKYLSNYSELFDLLSSTHFDERMVEDGGSILSEGTFYPTHRQAVDVADQKRAGKVYEGIIRCDRNDYNKCYVIVRQGSSRDKQSQSGEDARKSITVVGYQNVNRAVDGDLVAVELIDVDESEAKALQQQGTLSSSLAAAGKASEGVAEVSEMTAEPTADCIENLTSVEHTGKYPLIYPFSACLYLISCMYSFYLRQGREAALR